MELRKIQITGGSTHVVSLPKRWIDRNKLMRSDPLAIHEETDGSLLLVPHAESRSSARIVQVAIPAEPGQDEVLRRLVGAYLAGADEIHVQGEGGRLEPAMRQRIRAITRDLVGLEVLEETAGGMVLHDLVGVSDMDLRKSLTRMHRIARMMFDEAMQALQAQDTQLAKDVASRDDDLDRLLWMISKQMHALLEQPRLAAKLAVRPAEALNLFLAARAMERIGDHATKICHNVVELEGAPLPTTIVQGLVKQAEAVRTVWEDAFSSLKRPDFALASKAADAGKVGATWRSDFAHTLRNLPADRVGALTLIADSLDRVRGYAVDLAETAMNQTFQRPAT